MPTPQLKADTAEFRRLCVQWLEQHPNDEPTLSQLVDLALEAKLFSEPGLKGPELKAHVRTVVEGIVGVRGAAEPGW